MVLGSKKRERKVLGSQHPFREIFKSIPLEVSDLTSSHVVPPPRVPPPSATGCANLQHMAFGGIQHPHCGIYLSVDVLSGVVTLGLAFWELPDLSTGTAATAFACAFCFPSPPPPLTAGSA